MDESNVREYDQFHRVSKMELGSKLGRPRGLSVAKQVWPVLRVKGGGIRPQRFDTTGPWRWLCKLMSSLACRQLDISFTRE